MLKALERAFVASVIANDEKVVSVKKINWIKTTVQKPYTIWDQIDQNWYPIYEQNG